MPEHPENNPDDPEPLRGEVRYSQVSARIPEEIGDGRFASAVMVMTGPFEHVLDFIQRLSESPRVVARIVLPPRVVGQFIKALQQNIANYESMFGPLPRPPQVKQPPPTPEQTSEEEPVESESGDTASPFAMEFGGPSGDDPPQWTTHPSDDDLVEPAMSPPAPPNIQQIYDDLRLPDSLLSGRYANAVLIRHSPTEFCFDFITNIFPRSAVSSRVYLAAANVGPLLQSLQRSLQKPSS